MNFIFGIFFAIVVFLPSVIFHEIAHARTAAFFGDETAKKMGRFSFNPARHLDFLGVLAIILIGVGWAKPVPVNPRNFKNPRVANFWVALAGPAANIFLALCAGTAILFLQNFTGAEIFVAILLAILKVNCILAVFNLLPLPPLDGSKVVAFFLPRKIAREFLNLQNAGFIALFVFVGIERFFGISIFHFLVFLPAEKLRAIILLLCGF